MASKTGVLIAGFGGPDCLDAVGPFMCNLMGREPSEQLLEQVKTRYLAIGGSSPLGEIAAGIAAALSDELKDQGEPMPVVVGMCYWRPYIDDALAALKNGGVSRVIVVSLSPFESKVAQQAYRDIINETAERLGGLEIVEAPLVSELTAFTDYMATSTAAALTDLDPVEGAVIVFTAHSLPEEDLEEDDPYVAGLRRVADTVAERLGLGAGAEGQSSDVLGGLPVYGSPGPDRPWFLVYQSKGRKPGTWLGPDLDDFIEACATSGVPSIVVSPIGFLTDHMETLYDLDIVAADKALTSGVEFMRAPVPNDEPSLIKAIAEAVLDLK